MKFRYYLYFNQNNSQYILKERYSKRIEYSSFSFYSMYRFIKENKIDYNKVRVRAMSLYNFFKDFAYFEDENEKL